MTPGSSAGVKYRHGVEERHQGYVVINYIRRYKLCSGVAAYYAATPLHSSQRRNFTELLTTVTLARFKYELPDDGHRPKHVGAF